MRLLLIEIGMLDKEGQYAEIKVLQGSRGIEQIKADATEKEGEAPSRPLANTTAPAPNDKNPFSIPFPMLPSSTKANNNPTLMSPKGDN